MGFVFARKSTLRDPELLSSPDFVESGAGDRGAQEHSLRGSSSQRMFLNSCIELLRMYISMVRGVIGCIWRIGSASLRPEIPNETRYQDRAFEQRLLHVFNHGTISPKNGHVLHDAHFTAKCCCAPTCFFSIR